MQHCSPSDLFQRWAKTDFANLRVSQSHITHTIYAFSLFFFPTKRSSLL